MNSRIPLFIILFFFHCHQSNAQCSAVINTFPYQEGFEAGTANWVSGGTNNDWAWGSPTKPIINSAGAGTKCWISGGLVSSFYSYGERSWVESPCFDFTNLNFPYVSFLIFWDTEKKYDGGNFQYSLDGGVTWSNVGSTSPSNTCTDQNWFNASSIINLNGLVNSQQGWSGNTQSSSGSCNGGSGSGGWKLATHCMSNLANKPQVKFRFTFGSGTTCNDYDGIAFDDFIITNAPTVAADFTTNCTNGFSLDFKETNPPCHDHWSWDFGDGTTGTGKIASHTYSNGGTFQVTMTTGGNCVPDTQIIKQVHIFSATTNVTPVSCVGGTNGVAEIIVSNATGSISYSWANYPANLTSINSNLPVGDYYVTINDTGFCDQTLMMTVFTDPNATPDISLGNDTVICPGSMILLSPGSFRTYVWQDNSTDSFYVVKKSGEYAVSITNASGCTGSDSILIEEDCLNDIIIPNAFTPNDDGFNEIFNVAGSVTDEYKILIYDRWGEVIFQSEERLFGWDGSYKGNPVQEGIYNYIVDYNIYGVEKRKTGSIFLYR